MFRSRLFVAICLVVLGFCDVSFANNSTNVTCGGSPPLPGFFCLAPYWTYNGSIEVANGKVLTIKTHDVLVHGKLTLGDNSELICEGNLLVESSLIIGKNVRITIVSTKGGELLANDVHFQATTQLVYSIGQSSLVFDAGDGDNDDNPGLLVAREASFAGSLSVTVDDSQSRPVYPILFTAVTFGSSYSRFATIDVVLKSTGEKLNVSTFQNKVVFVLNITDKAFWDSQRSPPAWDFPISKGALIGVVSGVLVVGVLLFVTVFTVTYLHFKKRRLSDEAKGPEELAPFQDGEQDLPGASLLSDRDLKAASRINDDDDEDDLQ